MKHRKPTREMSRLIERGEFEQRLANYSGNVLKALNHLNAENAALKERVATLEAELVVLKTPPPKEPKAGLLARLRGEA